MLLKVMPSILVQAVVGGASLTVTAPKDTAETPGRAGLQPPKQTFG